MNKYIGWYVAPEDLHTSNDMDRRLPRFHIREGETLSLGGPSTPLMPLRKPISGKYGYSASKQLLNAMAYRAYGVITLVELSGDVDVQHLSPVATVMAGRSRYTHRIMPNRISGPIILNFVADQLHFLLATLYKEEQQPFVPEYFKVMASAVRAIRKKAAGQKPRIEGIAVKLEEIRKLAIEQHSEATFVAGEVALQMPLMLRRLNYPIEVVLCLKNIADSMSVRKIALNQFCNSEDLEARLLTRFCCPVWPERDEVQAETQITDQLVHLLDESEATNRSSSTTVLHLTEENLKLKAERDALQKAVRRLIRDLTSAQNRLAAKTCDVCVSRGQLINALELPSAFRQIAYKQWLVALKAAPRRGLMSMTAYHALRMERNNRADKVAELAKGDRHLAPSIVPFLERLAAEVDCLTPEEP